MNLISTCLQDLFIFCLSLSLGVSFFLSYLPIFLPSYLPKSGFIAFRLVLKAVAIHKVEDMSSGDDFDLLLLLSVCYTAFLVHEILMWTRSQSLLW